MAKSKKKTDIRSSRAYKFIIGFIIAIALIIFIISSIVLVIKIVPDTFSLVASTFQSVTSDEDTSSPAISLDKTSISSGDSIKFSWSELNQNSKYSLIFFCSDSSVSMRAYGRDFSCGDYIEIDNNDSSENILFSTEKENGEVTIVFESENEDGDIKSIQEVVVNISNDNFDDVEVTTTTTNTTTISNTRDLYVRILGSGDNFVQFEVRNQGNLSTGLWQFRAIIPTVNVSDRIFISNIQPSLVGGTGIVYTMTFNNTEDGTFVVQVDPNNNVSETNESNNQASVRISGDNNNLSSGDDADFDIDLLGYGRMSGNRFIETRNIDQNDELAIQFRVRNVGGETTDDWRFEVDSEDPDGDDSLDFRSRRYAELAPGEYRDIVISFDNLPDDGEYELRIEVDPDKDTNEETRSNNSFRVDIDVD